MRLPASVGTYDEDDDKEREEDEVEEDLETLEDIECTGVRSFF
jgi:hypothetical protein